MIFDRICLVFFYMNGIKCKENTKKKPRKGAFSNGIYKIAYVKNLADYKPIVAAISAGKYIPTPGPIGRPSVL